MNYDDITSIALDVFDALQDLGLDLDEDDDWLKVYNFMHELLDRFETKDRNYN